ncbi:MAG TPA: methylmalonyl-CoA mutase family protein, partial [Planctomycetota bacterium]|nr:methylmalonyl-CoA mutase family protein [Planctomycetota bacterium]
YYLETLTDKLEKEATGYIEQIDKLGGAAKAVASGFYQQEISRAAYEYQKEIENKNRIIVGVNKFTDEESSRIKTLKVTPALQAKQVALITRYKKNRDIQSVNRALAALKSAAQTNANLMPAIMEATRQSATLGEISQALREVFGEHKGAIIF